MRRPPLALRVPCGARAQGPPPKLTSLASLVAFKQWGASQKTCRASREGPEPCAPYVDASRVASSFLAGQESAGHCGLMFGLMLQPRPCGPLRALMVIREVGAYLGVWALP